LQSTNYQNQLRESGRPCEPVEDADEKAQQPVTVATAKDRFAAMRAALR
jgi:hypothetical protein